MSQALRKLTGSVSKSNTCLIFINQIREKIGVMFGNPETTTGGRALKFYSSVRLDIRRIAAIKDGDAVVGNRTKVKVVKNKVASPFREAEFDIIYGEGVSKEGDLLDLGVAQNLIEKSGSWFSYKGDRIGQGRENARQFLKDNPDIRRTIDTELRKALGLIKPDGAPVAAPVEAPPAAKPARRGASIVLRRCAAGGNRAPHASSAERYRNSRESMKKEEERQRAILLRLARMQTPSGAPEAFFPSGFRALDEALGGGFPRGHMVELFGPSGCGKTTLAIQCVAHAQKNGLTAAWIDADHTFDPGYATRLGVDMERMPFAQPASAEQGLEIARTLAGSGAVDLMVVDSAAALVPAWNWRPALATTLPACIAACWHQVCGSCVTLCRNPARASCFSIRCATGRRPRRARARPAPAECRLNFSLLCASR